MSATPREGIDRCDCGSKYWDGIVCHSCGETFPALECLDGPDGCKGAVERRPAMSPSGRRFPRCDAHFRERMTTQRRISRTYGTRMFYGVDG
jgi:hypothetical protein